LLTKYKEDFVVQHGKPPESKEDWQPVESEHNKYTVRPTPICPHQDQPILTFSLPSLESNEAVSVIV